MLTPQQIQDISFEKALFGGYDMDSVDDILEPLTEDYVTLYKENSVLKSKMRILVYRKVCRNSPKSQNEDVRPDGRGRREKVRADAA